MKVTKLTWAGTRTDRFDATVEFFGSAMGMELADRQEGFAAFRLPDGGKFEVFGPPESDHDFFTTGPVVGFGVDDVDAARAELERAGAKFIGPVRGEGDYKWSHFYGPDGNVYEITSS
jgi:catechol 2,3-dioxygenase-like lactoylglutathione lyase family enzyme